MLSKFNSPVIEYLAGRLLFKSRSQAISVTAFLRDDKQMDWSNSKPLQQDRKKYVVTFIM